MAKKVMGSFKLQLKAGEASMAPPVGPAFGQRGLAGMEFVKQFNAKTAKQQGTILPVVVTFFSDKSFTFEVKSPPAPVLLIKAAGIDKGSAEPNKTKVGKVTLIFKAFSLRKRHVHGFPQCLGRTIQPRSP